MAKKKVAKKLDPADSPLEVNLVDQKLTISIGIDTLAQAFLTREESLTIINGSSLYKIDDNKEFAKWVAWALIRGQGDGSSNRIQDVLEECFSELVDEGVEPIRSVDCWCRS